MRNRPRRLTDFSLVADLAQQWVDFNEPAAKLARRKERASRALTFWLVLTVLCGIAVATGSMPFITGGVIFGALAVRAGLRLRRLHRRPPPSAGPRRRVPPPRTSLAHEPMQRLGRAESSLNDLMARLPAQQAGPVIPAATVAEAGSTAADAAQALRELAARIVAIERARDAAPAGERASLDAALRTLREQLDEGVDSYGSLLAAAGHAVAASGVDLERPQAALTDATDRLAGMAIALRELGH